jgi:hypothetical protein
MMRLLLRLPQGGARSVEVLDAVRHPPGSGAALGPGAHEDGGSRAPVMAARLLSASREVLHEVVLPERRPAFFDRPAGQHGELVGGLYTPSSDLRSLDLPFPDGAVAMEFWEHRGPVDVSRARCLGAFSLRDPAVLEDAHPIVWRDAARAVEGPRPLPLSGRAGRPDANFTIVMLGDGFQQPELLMFQARAETLAKGILDAKPFHEFHDWIDVYVLPRASRDSGVDDCPFAGVEKDTFYNVKDTRHQHGGRDVGTHTFSTETWDILREVAEEAAPLEQVDVIVMLVNTPVYGGCAEPSDPDHRRHRGVVYIPIMDDDKLFIDVALHELGHVIGNLADEYMTEGAGHDPEHLSGRKNVTTAKRLENDKVSWHDLAFGYELEGVKFKAIHRLGDPIDPVTKRPLMRDGLKELLGAFWGAAFYDRGDARDVDVYTSPRGSRFYRPMARCKMRWTSEEFCRVCQHLIREQLRLVTGRR